MILYAACSGQKTDDNYSSILTGKYNFSMYDSGEVIIATGTLEIGNKNKNDISGTYSFEKVISEFQCYEFMNKGNFTGKINNKEKTVLINTNPGQADRNVFFNLNIEKEPYTGTWYCSQFRKNSSANKLILKKN